MDIKIVFHPSGDWEGLYIDGELENEGHSISAEDVIRALQAHARLVENITAIIYDTRDLGSEEGFDEDFSFPLKYEDIKA